MLAYTRHCVDPQTRIPPPSLSLSLRYFLLLLKTIALTPYEIVSTFHECWQIADLIFHRFVHLLINSSPRLIIFSSFGSRSFRKRFMRKLHSYVQSSNLFVRFDRENRFGEFLKFGGKRFRPWKPQALTPLLDKGRGGWWIVRRGLSEREIVSYEAHLLDKLISPRKVPRSRYYA